MARENVANLAVLSAGNCSLGSAMDGKDPMRDGSNA